MTQRDGVFVSFVVPYEAYSGTGDLFTLFAAHLQLGKGLVYQFELQPRVFVDVVLVGKHFFHVFFEFLYFPLKQGNFINRVTHGDGGFES